ncbi:MAG: M20/M25/M40 family metallo-hydrolase [Anaerolineaceae bacterium]|nr:M20/M25/M40 family metallo-hydrolase [Anaerolineaceae bacterium]
MNEIIEVACDIQQIAAPTFHERRRAEYISEKWQAAGLRDVSIDEVGNVWGCLAGGSRPPIIVAAHIDTVHPDEHLPRLEKSPERITGPGIGDNALGVASLFALAGIYQKESLRPSGDLWLVGTVGEEGLGDLKGMQAVVHRFRQRPSAYIIVEGIGLGKLFTRGLGVIRYRISIQTPGGHSWADYGIPSANHELAELITSLTKLPMPQRPRTTLNVGVIQGGSSVNTIACQAWLELDLRSEDQGALGKLAEQVNHIVLNRNRKSVKASIEQIGLRPAGELPADHSLIRIGQSCLRELKVQPMLEIASTDANIPLSRNLPAIGIGITTGGNVHTYAEYFNIEPIRTGLEQLRNLIEKIWEENESKLE